MIIYQHGDLLKSDAQAIVNTVNCVGVMGRGIALQFKKQFPDNFKFYEKACKNNEVIPGKMLVFLTGHLFNPQYIINFPTKRHWRGKSQLKDIELGLKDLVHMIEKNKISSIAIPPLGCGLGGLDWEVVKPLIEQQLATLVDVEVMVFEPQGAPANQLMAHGQKPKMTQGRAALILLIKRYLTGLLDPMITLLEIHKLMYFLQMSGEPLKLTYKKAYYGPYAENLKHVMNAIEGHMLIGYADGGDAPDKAISIVGDTDKLAAEFLVNQPDTLQRMSKVSNLIEGFETPFGLELLATVHWIAKDEVLPKREIINRFYEWGSQKSKFTKRQIEVAINRLQKMTWIDVLV